MTDSSSNLKTRMLHFRQAPQGRDWTLRYLLTFAALAGFWAVEHFALQASVFEFRPVTTHPGTYQAIRLGINLTVAVAILLVSNRAMLLLIVAADFILSLIIIAYNQYFHHAFSVYYGMKTLREGLKVYSAAFYFIPWIALLLLLLVMALKVMLIFEITPQPRRFIRRGAVLCLFAFVGFLSALQHTSFYFRNIPITRVTRAVYAYGYLNSWIAEFFVSPDTSEVTQELVELQRDTPDRLTGSEVPWPITTNVIVIQMESFGWNVLKYQANGRAVAPYLKSLADGGRVYKVQVYHSIGSEDMDYAVLSGGRPSMRMVSYLAPDISYTNALPRFMQRHGFETLSIHGANGDFFSRRSNFERMGFDEIWFQEDFHSRLAVKGNPVPKSYWGVRDAELFKISGQKLRAAARPQFHFIITLDSHVPFDLITDEEKEIFPHSQVWQQNYFNSINLLDHSLHDYIEALPKGTLVILYGDHPAGVDYGDFHSARDGLKEYVPCIVHLCGESLPQPVPMVASPLLLDDFRIHDVINYLRHQVEQQDQHPAASSLTQQVKNF
jgi:phosphoglycerol transferase MdoB-like AlkP superfamily enzyme